MIEEKDIHEQLREAGVAPGKQMTQTEKLGEVFIGILDEYDEARSIAALDGVEDEFEKTEVIVIKRLLQACKEAGLVFWAMDNIEEIEIE